MLRVNGVTFWQCINPLSPELNPICYLLALLAHDILHVSRISVKSSIAIAKTAFNKKSFVTSKLDLIFR
jgi:transposase